MIAPRILLATSRNPTARMRTLCNDLARMLPNALRVNRGKMGNEQLAEKALEHGINRVVVVERGQSGSGAVRFCKIGSSGLISIPPMIYVANLRLRRDFGTIPRVEPVRAIAVLSLVPSDDVKKFAEMLAGFFDLPFLSVDEADRSLGNLIGLDEDRAGRLIVTFMVEPGHVEVGPRLTLSKMEWSVET